MLLAESLCSEFASIAESHPASASALTEIVRLIANQLEVDVCSIYAVSGDDTLTLAATMGLNQSSVGAVQMSFREGLVGLVAEQLQPVFVPDASRHPRFLFFPEAGEEAFVSFLGIPILQDGRLRGVLVVQTIERRDFRSDWATIALAAQSLAPFLIVPDVRAALHG